MMRVEEVQDRAALEALRGPWADLIQRAPSAEVFQTYEWLASWLDCFWAKRPIAFLFVWKGPKLVGLAPLIYKTETATGCMESLYLPVDPHTRRQDVLCADDPKAVLEAIVEHLGSGGRRRRLALHQLPEDSPIGRAVPALAASGGLGTMKTSGGSCPIVRLDGTWDDYVAARPGQVGRELKRKMRKIERDWRARWTIAQTPEQAAEALKDVWEIERASWKEDEGSSLTAQQEAIQLYEDVVPRLARAGWLRLYLLHLDDKPAAHILGAEFRGTYFAFKTSYDQAFKSASPGQAIFYFALQDAFGRKVRTFDFLGYPSRWKDELANASREHDNLCLHSRFDARCRWHTLSEKQLKPFARENVPTLVGLGRRIVNPEREAG